METIKKVDVDQLIPGMYIHDLNCGWMDHPFWRDRFMIKDERTIGKLRDTGLREVYIDTSRGVDVPHAPTLDEVQLDTERRIRTLADIRQSDFRRTSLDEERRRAVGLFNDARTTVRDILQEARIGQRLEVGRAEPLIERLGDSIFRHIDALVPLARLKSHEHYTFDRSVANAILMIAFGRNLELDRDTVHDIALGALFQDVGMMRVPDSIISKPGRLSASEYRMMQSHVQEGEWLLEEVGHIPGKALEVVTQHHERFDGSGYPNHLRGEAISLFAQMGSIADVYDAMTSDRPYQRAEAPTVALRKLFEWGNFHFNPVLVQAFIRTLGIYPVGSLVRLQNQRLAVVLEQNPESLLRPRVKVIYDTVRRSYLTPYLVDLARNPPAGHEEIAGPETFERWQIDPRRWRLD